MTTSRSQPKSGRLPKELGLFDVYAISTGAMFSSGFFLLPGVAAAESGPSVVLAYLLAGVFIVPAMLSVAELSTAMPRAGGAYYFLDRALGPMVGTIGGFGAWFGLVFKSAFALVGMGAYLALVADVPIKPLALAFTLLFAVVNLVGAKETSGLQRVLVTALVAILTLFVVQGFVTIGQSPAVVSERFTPFLPFGVSGLLATVGLVFVSYAGLTKVASVAEEIRQPERNIPLGMALALATASVIYVAGVFILTAVIDPASFRMDLTPVATAADSLFGWMPGGMGLAVVVVAAIAAFASTGNAGILSASRYPLAMARDRLLPASLSRLGRFGTPSIGIVITSVTIAVLILFLDVEALAKFASAFTLLLFAMLNLAVIVMRESGLEAYDPGFRSPLYPWVQLLGLISPLWLIAEMGMASQLFTLALVAGSLVWYFAYARPRVIRSGAIYHTFARWGQNRFEGLDHELRGIVKEQALRPGDAYDEVVARAAVLDARVAAPYRELVAMASHMLATRAGVDPELLEGRLAAQADGGIVSLTPSVILPHARVAGLERPLVLLARCSGGVRFDALDGDTPDGHGVRGVLFVVSPLDQPGQHLRLLGHLAAHVADESFLERWMAAAGEQQLKESLLREEHSLGIVVGATPATWDLVGKSVADAALPEGSLIALIRRGQESVFPGGSTVLEEGDRVTFIGEPASIRSLDQRFSLSPEQESAPPGAEDGLDGRPPLTGAASGSTSTTY
jgi:amino acid transporter/mannitol/fructose-specific phosphotransferase system IIA component (Ntr-type)